MPVFVRASRGGRNKAHVRSSRKARKGSSVQRLEKLFAKAHRASERSSMNWVRNNPGLRGKPLLIDARTDFSNRHQQFTKRVEALRDMLGNARAGRGPQRGQMKFFRGGRY